MDFVCCFVAGQEKKGDLRLCDAHTKHFVLIELLGNELQLIILTNLKTLGVVTTLKMNWIKQRNLLSALSQILSIPNIFKNSFMLKLMMTKTCFIEYSRGSRVGLVKKALDRQ